MLLVKFITVSLLPYLRIMVSQDQQPLHLPKNFFFVLVYPNLRFQILSPKNMYKRIIFNFFFLRVMKETLNSPTFFLFVLVSFSRVSNLEAVSLTTEALSKLFCDYEVRLSFGMHSFWQPSDTISSLSLLLLT